MLSRDFCYWLMGFFELSAQGESLDANQVKIIKNHLEMVFKHEIDPSMGDKTHQDQLRKLHSPGPNPNTKLMC